MHRTERDQLEAAIIAAKSLIAARYAKAAFALVAGSIIRGQGTLLSDIDLVVIYPHVDNARRESFLFDGFPFEVFVHDHETLRWFMDKDIARGRPSIVNMVAEGHAIGPDSSSAESLRGEAAASLAKGPPELTEDQLNALRYEVTDKVDDLRGKRSSQEIRAIGAALYQTLADLILLGRGAWTGNGKWIPRLLGALDEVLAREFDDAFQRLFVEGDAGSLIAFTTGELERHGGRLFEGDCRVAPVDARRKVSATPS